MKKNILDLLFLLLLFTLFILIINNLSISVITTKETIYLWFNKLFIFLFPIYIFLDLLINYNIIDIINESIYILINRLFHIRKESSLILIISLLLGSPSNTIYIKELLDKKIINNDDALYLLSFTQNINPFFIISLSNNNKINIIIIISLLISNTIVGIIIRPRTNFKTNNIKINILKDINIKNKNFIKILSSSISKSFVTLINILGIIIFFNVVTNIISSNLNINVIQKSIIKGILEITNGLNDINALNINENIKIILKTMLLSFGGLSIHLQNLNILCDYKIKYKYYLIIRIITSILSGTLVYIFIHLIQQ